MKSDNIQKLTQKQGRDYPVAIVTKLLSDSLGFVRHRLTTEQMVGYANMFISGNPTLTIDEIVIILTKGINGQYGKAYGDFDYSVLMEWRTQYEATDRADYFEEKNRKRERDEPRTSTGDVGIGSIIRKQIDNNKPKN